MTQSQPYLQYHSNPRNVDISSFGRHRSQYGRALTGSSLAAITTAHLAIIYVCERPSCS